MCDSIKKNNMQIKALKFLTFANYSLNINFLRITTIKVSKFTAFRTNNRIPTTEPEILTTKMVGVLWWTIKGKLH